jgi:multisubunit Na+/H+ antiporter MnhB subunit
VIVLLCTSPGLRETRTIAADYLARSLPEAGGRNAVNVIIVDFRAVDTLGEITVLVVVGLCVYGLLRARRREA